MCLWDGLVAAVSGRPERMRTYKVRAGIEKKARKDKAAAVNRAQMSDRGKHCTTDLKQEKITAGFHLQYDVHV